MYTWCLKISWVLIKLSTNSFWSISELLSKWSVFLLKHKTNWRYNEKQSRYKAFENKNQSKVQKSFKKEAIQDLKLVLLYFVKIENISHCVTFFPNVYWRICFLDVLRSFSTFNIKSHNIWSVLDWRPYQQRIYNIISSF